MYSVLYTKTNYLNKNIDYLLNTDIREYDLKSAGLSLIKYFKLLPEKDITYLDKMEKEPRNKQIGIIQKDKEFAKRLLECFSEARRMFFEANLIQDTDILAIKKDAIFIIGRYCHNNTFSDLEFRVKNQYLGYMWLNKKEFYYTNPNTDLDVKGLGSDVLVYHRDYMLDYMRDVFSMSIYSPRESLISYITDFISNYRNRRLSYGYYRNLDIGNFYTVIDDDVGRMNILDVDDSADVNLDITFNYFNYILPIARIFI